MANMLILFYLFCSGKMEDNLTGIFNLFDQDGNKVEIEPKLDGTEMRLNTNSKDGNKVEIEPKLDGTNQTNMEPNSQTNMELNNQTNTKMEIK